MTSQVRLFLVLSAFTTISTFGSLSHAGTQTICAKWPYSFVDQGGGEDGLLHNNSPTHGRQSAAYSFAYLLRNGALHAQGVLNSSGCLNATQSQSGSYQLFVETYLYTPLGTYFDIRRTESSSAAEFIVRSFELSTNPTWDVTYNFEVGVPGDPVVNAMAVAVQFAKESHIGLASDQSYKIVAYSGVDSGYFPETETLHIGDSGSPGGTPDAGWKYVIAHELGHAVQHQLFGLLDHDYAANAATGIAQCLCDHVDISHYPANRHHCMQSRERQDSAQNEAFAHFIALDAMNNDSQSDAKFLYYKEFMYKIFSTWLVEPPPSTLDATFTAKWMKTECPTPATGVAGIEFDWMAFYYALHTKGGSGKFYYSEFKDTYVTTCPGSSCNDDSPNWPGLNASVNSLYGPGTPRRNNWLTQSTAYGVDQ